MMRANFHLKLLFPEVIQSHCISDLFFSDLIKLFCESEDHAWLGFLHVSSEGFVLQEFSPQICHDNEEWCILLDRNNLVVSYIYVQYIVTVVVVVVVVVKDEFCLIMSCFYFCSNVRIHHNFSSDLELVSSSRSILHVCFAAVSIADVDFPLKRSRLGKK